MKRPQFSLRSILLVVTLIAICLGLWEALVSSEREARHNRVRAWKSVLANLESAKARLENEMQTGDDLSWQSRAVLELKSIGPLIDTTKRMIAEQSD
jgi:hypothetical protein